MRIRIAAFSLSWLIAVAAPAQWADAESDQSPGDSAESTPKRYPWRFRRFDTLDATVTGVTGAGFMYVHFGVDPPREARWTSTWSIEDDVRDIWVADSREGRDRADFVSDIFWYVPLGLPWVDLTFPLFADDWNWDTAWQMTAINLQAFAVSGFITRSGHRFVGRARPDVDECYKDGEYSKNCFAGSFASFPSGHTSTAAVGAGLVCAHHLKLDLLGSDVADGLVCGVSSTMAVGAGVMRMVADRHYVADVVTGAAIGFGSGLALPLLRHYREPEPAEADAAKVRWTMAPSVQGPDGLGLTAYGWF